MKFIWYNPDIKEYKYGNVALFNDEIQNATNPNAYTVLMEFDKNSESLATKIIKQLNLVNNQPVVKMSA